VGRLTNPRAWLKAAAAIGACSIAVAGCGGSGDDSSSQAPAAAQIQTPTAPNVATPGQSRPGDRTSTTNTTPTPSGTDATHGTDLPSVRKVLAPFRACLSSHGVDPVQFGRQFRGGPQQQQDPAQARKAIQAGIACIPELPPRLRQAAERLKRRYERRQGQPG
jgi:hypothetical protein